jgi:hypothetical protein
MARTPELIAEYQMSYANTLNRTRSRAVLVRSAFLAAYEHTSSATQIEMRDAVTGQRVSADHDHLALAMLAGEFHTFHSATPVLVTDNAHALIDEAAEMLPIDEVLLPSECGTEELVLWLSTPFCYELTSQTVDGEVDERWAIHAMTLTPTPMGTTDAPDDVAPGLQIVMYGHLVSFNGLAAPQPSSMNDMVPVDMVGVRCNVAWHYPQAVWVTELKRWIIAMYRLMGDHIERENVRLDRAARRRLERAGFPNDGYVTELRLRKVAYGTDGEGGGSTGPLRFRHRVRGHWRKFYCPSMGRPVGDPEAYRHKFVNDYVRGPKSESFVDSTRVVTLAR